MKKRIVVVALISGVLGSSYAQDWDNFSPVNRERHGISGRFSSDNTDSRLNQFRSNTEQAGTQSREYQQTNNPQYQAPQYQASQYQTPQYQNPRYNDMTQTPQYREPAYADSSRPVAYREPAYADTSRPVAYRDPSYVDNSPQNNYQYRDANYGNNQYGQDEDNYYANAISPETSYRSPRESYRQDFDEGNFVMNDQTGEKMTINANWNRQAEVNWDNRANNNLNNRASTNWDNRASTNMDNRANANRDNRANTNWNSQINADNDQQSANTGWERQVMTSALPHEDRRVRKASFDDNFMPDNTKPEKSMNYESQRQTAPQRRENIRDNQNNYRKKPLIGNPFRGATKAVSRIFGR